MGSQLILCQRYCSGHVHMVEFPGKNVLLIYWGGGGVLCFQAFFGSQDFAIKMYSIGEIPIRQLMLSTKT